MSGREVALLSTGSESVVPLGVSESGVMAAGVTASGVVSGLGASEVPQPITKTISSAASTITVDARSVLKVFCMFKRFFIK